MTTHAPAAIIAQLLAPTVFVGVFLGVMVGGTAACGVEDSAAVGLSWPGEYQPALGAIDGVIVGDIGPASLDRDADNMSTFDDGVYLSVETAVFLEAHVVMTRLNVSNGEFEFQPGVDAVFTFNDPPEGMHVTMLGCVGQALGVYEEYDAPADEVALTVLEGRNDRELLVEANAIWRSADLSTGEVHSMRARTTFTLLR